MQISENKIGMIMNKKATKSNGISFLAQKYNIDVEISLHLEMITMIYMLEFCGMGIYAKM